jgi:hypothetical protein
MCGAGDTRFDDIRSHFLKFAGFWVGQVCHIPSLSLRPRNMLIWAAHDGQIVWVRSAEAATPSLVTNSQLFSRKGLGRL